MLEEEEEGVEGTASTKFLIGSWGSSVRKVSDYRLEDRGWIPGVGNVFLL
jgi:hypothetical protein